MPLSSNSPTSHTQSQYTNPAFSKTASMGLSPRRQLSAPIMMEFEETTHTLKRLASDVDDAPETSRENKTTWRYWRFRLTLLLHRHPFLHAAFHYVALGAYFLAYRCMLLPFLIDTFGSSDENTISIKVRGVVLGLCQDFCWTSYMLMVLSGMDSLFHCCTRGLFHRYGLQLAGCIDGFDRVMPSSAKLALGLVRFGRFLLHFLVFFASVIVFCADSVLIRTRQLRFTLDWITMYFRDRGIVSSLPIAREEVEIMRHTIILTILYGLVYAVFATTWIDLTKWNPLIAAQSCVRYIAKKTTKLPEVAVVDLPDSPVYASLEQGGVEQGERPLERADSTRPPERQRNLGWLYRLTVVLLLCWLVVLQPLIVQALAYHTSYVVASIALNSSLNEVFRVVFQFEFLPPPAPGIVQLGTNQFIHDGTEDYEAFRQDVLYRKTTGFKGPLAFDVKVDPANLPNVLVLVVESFRHHDSQWLLGKNQSYLMANQTKLTITPQFDKWAQRGVTFRNLWSSYRTSRSVESILFGQIPYDSVTDSGTTGGRKDTKLSGMPQFFKQKGYDAMFTTGCRTDYDQWEKFLPSHGFDTVLAKKEFMEIAERDLGIDPNDWKLPSEGGQGRAHSDWGVHDDVAFEVLGNLMINKTREKKASGKPFFINHYTISTHVPFYERPTWFENYEVPIDLSPLYKNQEEEWAIKQYVEIRYFQDMVLGKFMDRMAREGVLNDTIVVIVGDHGQAPELGLANPEPRQMSTTRVAATMIAEGRLGNASGYLLQDAAAHYDLLPTLMDIIGLPSDGFFHSGVGRSLKRAIPFGERVAWSINPTRKMAAIQGHKRIEFDRVSNAVAVYDAEFDHDRTNDLYPSMTPEEKQALIQLRGVGRNLNQYFKHRWDDKCILDVEC